MKLMNIHAHQDDFEFTAAGLFEKTRRLDPKNFEGKITVCTDGAAGHHLMSREKTSEVRHKEQRQALKIANLIYEPLKYPNGSQPKEGCMTAGPELLAAIWHSIRTFEPGYLFAPPLPTDNRVGVHVDHVVVAEAVRKVAYLINVPQAYLDFYPDDEPPFKQIETPVIINVMDSYMGLKDAFDIVIDISDTFEHIAEMSWCHQSQISEWLPWVGRHQFEPPTNFNGWKEFLLARMEARQRKLGLPTDRLYEFFCISGWGNIPTISKLTEDLKIIDLEASNLEALEKRLKQWANQGT